MSEEKKIYCTQCGSENAAGSKFCVNCGSKLEELPAQNDTAEAAQEMPEEKNVYAEGNQCRRDKAGADSGAGTAGGYSYYL